MTKYEISLYYNVPLPEYFKKSMIQMLDQAVDNGILSGYEFTSEDTVTKERKHEGAKTNTSGHDSATKQGDEKRNNKGKAGRTSRIDKEVRSNKSDNGKTNTDRV